MSCGAYPTRPVWGTPSQVMLALRDADRHDEVMVYWRQLVCVNGIGDLEIAQETFVLALRAAARVCAWDEIEVILGMMQVGQ